MCIGPTKSIEERKQFAREQYHFLRNHIQDRLTVSRIFKAAGPGQIQEAWKLAHCEDWAEDRTRKELLASILIGAEYLELSQKAIEQILSSLGFYVPQAHNEDCFIRILNGAVEIMFPGSHDFSDRELEEIKAGLKKRVYDN